MATRIWRRLLLIGTLCLSQLSGTYADDKSDDSEVDQWRQFHVRLDQHPVGYTLHKRHLQFNSLVPLHPAGFAAERTSHYPAPVLGLGRGWEAFVSVSSAIPLGQPHDFLAGRFFYGGGLQKQLAGDAEMTRPALSIGGYGYTGPNSMNGATGYIVGSHRLWQKPQSPAVALFGHLGVKIENFNNATNDTGVRPFAGGNLSLSRIVFLRGEFSPRQSWEFEHRFSAKAIFLFYKGKYGISVGMRGNGYRNYSTIDMAF